MANALPKSFSASDRRVISDYYQLARDRHQATRWAQRLKRVFNIDIETCANCGGQVKVIACIEDPVVIKKIQDHKQSRKDSSNFGFSALHRGAPQRSFFD